MAKSKLKVAPDLIEPSSEQSDSPINLVPQVDEQGQNAPRDNPCAVVKGGSGDLTRDADARFATSLLMFLDEHSKSNVVLGDEHTRFKESIATFCKDSIAGNRGEEEPSGTTPDTNSTVSGGLGLEGDVKVLLAMISALCTKKQAPNSRPTCDVKLAELTSKDIALIASGLQWSLKKETDEDDAVEKFMEYPAIAQLNEKHEEFKDTMINFRKAVLADKQKFAKVKLFVAAALSVGDMMTDIYMIFEYLWQGEEGYAWTTLGSLVANVVIQSLTVYFQNKKLPWKRQIWEQLYVWTFVKPGVDAWRVASETEQELGKLVHPGAELVMVKCSELFTEAIPGAIIQLSALLELGSKSSNNAVFSSGFSIFTAAFTSTVISWDFDTNKEFRKVEPSFYGYVHSNVAGKVKVFLSLLFMSAFNLFVRAFTVTLLVMQDGMLGVTLLLGAELFLYLIIKVARRDFWFWILLYGAGGIFIAISARIVVKVITDWTSLAQFRSPIDVGGAYFTFSLLLTVTMGMVAALRYEHEKEEVGENMIPFANATTDASKGVDEGGALAKSTVVTLMFVAFAGIVLSFTVLMTTIDKKYRKTFYSTKTSNKHIQEFFTKNKKEELRLRVLVNNRHKWEKTIGNDVRAWLKERLPVWLDEEPEWFTPLAKSAIPDDFVDDPDLLKRLHTPNVEKIIEQRRRSSVTSLLGMTEELEGLANDKVDDRVDAESEA